MINLDDERVHHFHNTIFAWHSTPETVPCQFTSSSPVKHALTPLFKFCRTFTSQTSSSMDNAETPKLSADGRPIGPDGRPLPGPAQMQQIMAQKRMAQQQAQVGARVARVESLSSC